jgi:hypothetical protein
MAKPVSQSRTMWVKKGDVVNGEKVKKGYVAQYGKPEKRVTNRVKLVVDTPKRGKAGDVVRLKQGAYVKKKAAAPSSNKGGSGGSGSGGAGGSGSNSGTKSNYKTASRMGKPGQYQAGAGTTSRRPASSGTVSSAIAQGRKMGPSGTSYKPKPKTAAQQAVSKSSGYVRGSMGSQAQIDAMKGKGTLKSNLVKKRAEDTRNQGRNALGIAGLAAAPFLAAGGAKLGGAALAARLGTAAMQQGASQGLQSGARYAAGQGAARGSMAAAKAAAKPKRPVVTNKDIGATTRGISKKTGGVLKNGKPVTAGPRKPTAAQVATQRRQIAAKKAAATRRANSAKAEDARRASVAKAAAARRANAAKKKK